MPRTKFECEAGRRSHHPRRGPAEVAFLDECQARASFRDARDVGTVTAGTLRVRHDDGTEQDLTLGAAYVIETGHDAWVTSSEPFIAFELESATAEAYAKPS